MKKKVLDCQSLWDIALRESGDITGAWEMAEASGIGLTDKLSAGQEIEAPFDLKNKQSAAYYALHDIHPATAITMDIESGEGALLLEGIEFWGIEYDFIIS